MSLVEDLKTQWRTGGVLVRLLLINCAAFIGIWLAGCIVGLSSGTSVRLEVHNLVTNWLGAPTALAQLIRVPWTVVTYMFTHQDFGHIFWNMLLLWMGGRLFLDLLGGKRLLGTYLLGGLAGLFLFILVQNVFGRAGGGALVYGASASVVAVFVCIASYRPQMLVHLILIGPVKLMYVAAVMVLLDFMGMGSGDGVAHEAHIGGALYGFLAAQQLKRGTDWSLGLANALDRFAAFFKRTKGPRMRVEKSFATRSGRGNDEQFNAHKRDRQARVDAILDKISRSGYDSLSKEEKDILFKEKEG